MKKIISAFIIWRILLFFIAAIAPKFIEKFGNKFPYVDLLIDSKLPYYIWSFGNFDGVHYISIAKHAYEYQYTQAFFPVYPLIIKIFSLFTFGNFVLAGILVSNTLFLFAIILFYKLILKKYNEKTAYWSVLFMLFFPTSFYFGSIYTEGLFIFLIILFYYLIENNRILLASIVGVLTSATRLIGVLLIINLFRINKIKQNIPLIIIPLGLLLYMFYLKLEFNNPLYFLTAQSIFGQERSTSSVVLLPQVFYRYLKILATASGTPLLNAIFELISTVFALIALAISYKKVKTEWIIFSLLAIIIPTLTGTLASMPRYIIIAFPIYIVLAQIKNKYLKISILLVFILMLSISTIIFTRGYWVA